MTDLYAEFLKRKERRHVNTGLVDVPSLHESLFPWQRDVVGWALRKGRACLFEDCGLGKTFQQLEWAAHVPGSVILLTPLAVSFQTEAEAARFGIDAHVSRDGQSKGKITITNYEQMHRFDLSQYQGIVLDESSILKSHDGRTRNAILDAAQLIPFRLACTATPAPNDHIELGNHAEFVGAMTRSEMLATFFVHDGGDTAKWRLKGHAVKAFWEWVATWAVMVRTPSDLGYPDEGFSLPELRFHEHHMESGIKPDGELFATSALTLNDQRAARRKTIDMRVGKARDIVGGSHDSWLVWCELNDEGDALESAIGEAVQVAGADDDDTKATRMASFSDGTSKILITKPKIGGFGMNWQHCHQMVFVGLSHSWEQFYQATRRCWRFGQVNPVDVHVIVTDAESAILDSIKRKQAAADDMGREMVEHMRTVMNEEIRGTKRDSVKYERDVATGEGWTMHLGDCVEVVKEMESDSVDYSVFSPPFASLYTYSASDRDMGNCTTHDSFFEQFDFLVADLFRVIKPGRLLSFHCFNIPLIKERDGVIGLTDFRGRLIQQFVSHGWIYHSEVTIWKDPVTAMQRTKALGLLHKQLKKDSCMSRQGIPDYLVTMRKPGDNPNRVTKTNESFPVSKWQEYASPVWMDIDQSDTLQHRSAREDDDERHVCPLQLEVIRRAVELWTNPGDLVLSPFAGIGSEGYVAIEKERRFVGVELKKSYWKQACENIKSAKRQTSLF
jgi:DNA modification methylase